jgi:hypothetical protein
MISGTLTSFQASVSAAAAVRAMGSNLRMVPAPLSGWVEHTDTRTSSGFRITSPLKSLTRSLLGPVDQSAPADQGAGEADETVVDVEASFPTDSQPAELVQQGEGLLDDVAQLAEAFDTAGLGFRDDRFGATVAARLPERCAAVSLVGQQRVEASSWPASASGDRRIAVEQVEGSADVGDVRAAGQYVDRGAVPVADQVVLAAGLAAVDR